ncbi:response regulatory protein [Streptococcus pyogenes]|nr:response regulator [Streptococcus pyogenes]VGQ71656.1 response regulator [Streptococcus pyogenes]VGU92399.1 response regulatory protein [Streptococcus pyogenes]
MRRKKGLDIALEIRKKDPRAIIVFVTTHSEFMPLSFQYQVSALDFIDKELSEGDFFDRIKSALSYAHASQTKTLAEDSFIFETSKSQLQVSFADLLFIETSHISHKLILHSMKEVIEFYGQLSEVLDQDKRLYQCHRSFVVNPYNLARIEKEERVAYFNNGASCLVSRLKIKGLTQLLEEIHRKEN